jgi:multidrug efflux pump subunit AcrA (membrane-fusion protein)
MEMPNALDAYLSAVEKFQQCAAPVLENLTKAREAYEEALQASTEIRQILTSQDDVLGSVMVKLRDTVSQQLVRKSEPKKVIPMLPGDDAEEVVALLRQSLLEGQSKLADNETGGEASAAPQESGADIKKPAATDEKTGTEAPAEPKKKRWM